MTTAVNIFVITLMVNLALVGFGFASDNSEFSQLSNEFVGKTDGGNYVNTSKSLIDSVNPDEFVASSTNTGDDSQSDFKIIDTLSVVKAGLKLLLNFFTAPLMMALALNWPGYLIVFVAIPWMMLFWISLLMVIRGIG